MKFDVRAAKALKAGDHLTVEGAPGLRLEASATRRAWIYRYKSPVDGKMKQAKIGEWPRMSAAQAGVEWERLRGQRAAGRDEAEERRDARKATLVQPKATPAVTASVGDLIEQYVEWAAPRRTPKGAAELRRTLSVALDDKFRAQTPAEVTRTVAFDLVSRYAATPVQASSLRRELGAAWEWGHDSGRIADTVPNWWRQILRGKLKSKGKIVDGEHQGISKRFLEVDEVGKVVRHLPHLTRINRDLVTLYLWTGCRGAELVQMEGREVAADERGVLWWTLPKAKQKMRRHELAMDMPVPIIGRAREIVLARKEEHGDGHLFPPARGKSRFTEQKTVGVAVWWHMPTCNLRPECERARWPVEGWTPHDLRRTVRTHLARLGCPGNVAEAVLGHIDPDAGIYNRREYRGERLLWLTRIAETWERASNR